MKFDYCIGNPPYQLLDGGDGLSAIPIYQHFSETAKNIATVNCFIQPSRWITGGKGLDNYRDIMIHDKHIKLLHDYVDSRDIFNIEINGGICIYLRDENYEGDCKNVLHDKYGVNTTIRPLYDGDDDIFIRNPVLLSIKNKINNYIYKSLTDIVSTQSPYGIASDFFRDTQKYGLPAYFNEPQIDGYRILGLGDKQKRCWKYLPKDYPIPRKNNCLMKYKVFISKACSGHITDKKILTPPVLSHPTELCTQTFLQIGPFDTKEEAIHLLLYIKTKFFRALVSIKKQTQNASRKVYQYVPIQDFTSNSDIKWEKSMPDIDKQLYQKYGLSQEEIDFIENRIDYI